jgi:glycosyltransferase involved in cell wall biosynthesis
MDGKPIKILMITPFFSPNIGGVETHLDDLCEYLRKRGHKIFVITYQPLTTNVKALKFERDQNLEVRRIGWFGYSLFHKLEPYPLLEFMYLTPILLVYSFLFFFRYKNDVDVIHAHGLNAAFISKILSSIFKKRTVVSIHALYNLPKKPNLARLIKLTLSSFDSILTLALKSKMELINLGLDNRNVKVFTYWINQRIFRPLNRETCKEKLRISHKMVVLFVGRLIEIKGPLLLIQIANKLNRVNKNICFVFIGDGPLASEVKKASTKLENVVFVGKVENKNLNTYYNAADLVVMPSLYEEGFGRVVLEALSCGTPVLASNRGGIPEALDQSVGVLVEPSISEIGEEIQHLYIHREDLLRLATHCRAYAEERFSERNAKIIEESYLA